MQESIFVVLVIVGVISTILAFAALAADYFFQERSRPDRPAQRAQATYRRTPK